MNHYIRADIGTNICIIYNCMLYAYIIIDIYIYYNYNHIYIYYNYNHIDLYIYYNYNYNSVFFETTPIQFVRCLFRDV